MSGADNVSLTVRNLVGQTQQQSVRPSDSVIVWLSNGFAIYTLPPAALWPGRMLTFIQDNGGSGSIQVLAANGDTADGTTQSWDVGGALKGRMTIVSDGISGWWSTVTVNVVRI